MKIKVLSISLIFIISLFISLDMYSQRSKDIELTSKSRKAKKAFKRAISFFEVKQYKDALIEINTALKHDSNFVEAYLMAGQIYDETKSIRRSIYYYRKASIVNPDFYPEVFITLATMEISLGLYSDALIDFNEYKKQQHKNERYIPKVNAGIEYAEFGKWNVENPVEYNPVNVGSSVNTKNDEYINTINTEENRLIFTRKFSKNARTMNQRNTQEEDFYQSIRPNKDQEWIEARRMSTIFNTSGNEGAMNISPDQSTMVFTACYRNDSRGRCDIYISHKKGKRWETPYNVGAPVNTGDWETNACLSSDGKTLYFVRRMGRGNSDIFTAELMPDGRYANVKNIGAPINTKGSEMTPFIHADGRTLYFSSDGHLGMGGMDLYMTRKDNDGKWGPAVNLGYPINDYKNQMGIIINSNGNIAYISSDMKGSMGGYDIYSFDLYKNARPVPVNYMKGVVADIDTKKPLSADFKLYDLSTNKLIVESKSDKSNGSFVVTIPNDAQLALNVSKDGYLFYSENFIVKEGHTSLKPFLKNVYLKKISVNQKIVLNNIFFASLSYDLEEESVVELAKVKELLQRNPKLKIEIGGHTDNVGSDADNIRLSNQRAKAVKNYLVETLKVDTKRISSKGYGEAEPVSNNETEEGRALNRRIEIKVVAF